MQAAGLQPIPRSCERLSAPNAALNFGSVRIHPVALPGARVGVAVVCSNEVAACRRRVTLRAPAGLLGRSRLVRVRHGVSRVRVRLRPPLPAAGVVTVAIVGTDGGRRAPYRFSYRLRR